MVRSRTGCDNVNAWNDQPSGAHNATKSSPHTTIERAVTYMKNTSHVIGRLAIASVLASGLVSVGVAASAQTTAASATTTITATAVSMSTVDAKAQRQVELERENADARRSEFLHLGTSL